MVQPEDVTLGSGFALFLGVLAAALTLAGRDASLIKLFFGGVGVLREEFACFVFEGTLRKSNGRKQYVRSVLPHACLEVIKHLLSHQI